MRTLKDNIENNVDIYYGNQTFENYFDNADHVLQTRIPHSNELSDKLVLSNLPKDDIANSLAVYNALSHLSPEQATDVRLWTYLCHYDFKDYASTRWLNNGRRAIKDIKNHFFVPIGIRGLIRDNAISRLWWLGYFATKVSKIVSLDPLRILEIMFFRTDVRANLIERTTVSSNFNLSAIVIKLLNESYEKQQTLFDRTVNRTFMKEINALGGYKLLDILTTAQIEEECLTILNQKMQIESF